MKKSLLLLLSAFLLSLSSGAVTLAPNQILIGHYTTDDLATTGWGQGFMKGVNPIATDLTPDELALSQGGKLVSFRIGLADTTTISRLFVMFVDAAGKQVGDITEWPCNVAGQVGWNMIELETPYEINVPDAYQLRIGFDYRQYTTSHKPISAVDVGTIYPSYVYRNGRWMNYGTNTVGNLSLQCVVENDDFQEYIVRLANLFCKSTFVVGEDQPISFQVRNMGVASSIAAGELTFDIAIDGNVVKTITNPEAVGRDYVTIQDVLATDGLTAGAHTLTVSAVSINGEPIETPASVSITFKCFEFGFTRQMHLVEQFTSTGCTWCPTGSANVQNLCAMRNDVAWVGVHSLFGSPVDPFATAQSDSIRDYQGVDGYPEGTFDRSMGIGSANELFAVLSATTATTMSNFFDHLDEEPSWATVNVNSRYDAETRNAVITIDGKLVANYEDFMGSDSRLTVYITEDNLVAAQLNQGNIVNNYVHNGVLRKSLVSAKGVALNKHGDTYKNEFTLDIPENWNADNLNIVAFISRPLNSGSIRDLYVTNTNKRKLGEFDEPAVVQGDADGDGKVLIDDVTALIDSLLRGVDPVNPAGADCNVDGVITIDDVTVLIDYLLRGEWSE
jgi:hypothetical protein